MDDYIERDKTLDIFLEGDGDDEFTEGYNFAVNEYRAKIKAMTSADAQTVKHGKWNEIYHDSENYSASCSYCQEPTVRRVSFRPYDFCPHCGARMDLKEGEKDG